MRFRFSLFLMLWGFSGCVLSQSEAPAAILSDDLHWKAVPNISGLQGAWVLGSEQAPGAYVLRVRLAADGRIPPHSHPDTRISTVLSGTLYVGFGESFNEGTVVAVPSGGMYVAPANVPHFIWARDGSIEYQESGDGPTGTVMAGTGDVSRPVSENPLSALSWLAGCWAGESAETGSGEQWLVPAGGAMIGISRTVRDGKMVAWETMRIQAAADGNIVFVANPHNQPEAIFALLNLTDDAVTFENLQHDFPQRISYRAVSDDRISARAEGSRNGVPSGVDFPMARVTCESPPR